MIVVTGAGAGIGQGIAQAFHAAGGRVALGDLRQDAAERAAAALGGDRVFAGGVDVREALPIMLDHVARSMRQVKFRTVLAVDLWPVKLEPAELKYTLMTVAHSFRETMRRRQTIIDAARNCVFDRPELITGLIGRFVVVSLSDGGHRVPRNSATPVFDPNPVELGIGQSLNQVFAFAKSAGGAATIKATRTARNVVTTIVRIYLAQHSTKPKERTGCGSKEPIAVGRGPAIFSKRPA